MKVASILLAAGIFAAASSAQAVVTPYDFNGFLDGTDISGIDLGGLTLSGGPITVTGGVASSNSAVTGTFSMFGVINVSLDISGDASISAFDLNNSFINSDSGNTGALALFAPGAYSVSFGAGAEAFSFDNLTIETIAVAGGGFGPSEAAIPVPAALPLMATAIAGAAFIGSRRRK